MGVGIGGSISLIAAIEREQLIDSDLSHSLSI